MVSENYQKKDARINIRLSKTDLDNSNSSLSSLNTGFFFICHLDDSDNILWRLYLGKQFLKKFYYHFQQTELNRHSCYVQSHIFFDEDTVCFLT